MTAYHHTIPDALTQEVGSISHLTIEGTLIDYQVTHTLNDEVFEVDILMVRDTARGKDMTPFLRRTNSMATIAEAVVMELNNQPSPTP